MISFPSAFRFPAPVALSPVAPYSADAFRLAQPTGSAVSSFAIVSTEWQPPVARSERPMAVSSWSDLGHRLLRPHRPREKAVLKVARETSDPQELLELLVARGAVPRDWLERVDGFAFRGFIDGDDEFSEMVHSLPHSTDLLISLASDPVGVRQAELLALEALKRFQPWKNPMPTVVLWRSIDVQTGTAVVVASLERFYGSVRSDLNAAFVRQSEDENLEKSRRMSERAFEIFIQLDSRVREVFRFLFNGAFNWEEASRKGLSAGEKNFRDLPNAFEPLTGFGGLCSLGYALLDVHEFMIDGKRELCVVLGAPKVNRF